jgi:hypothetical protein
MPELSGLALIGLLVVVVVMVAVTVKLIPLLMGRQCPKCLRRVPKGRTTCKICGATVVQ